MEHEVFIRGGTTALVLKKLKEIDKSHTDEQILIFLKDNYFWLKDNMSKISQDAYRSKIFYVCKSIKNHINKIGES